MIRNMKIAAALALSVLLFASCGTNNSSTVSKPAAVSPPATSTTALLPNGPITYTVEPFDYDGTLGITMTVTQDQFGGRQCPCTKIPYPADGTHNQQGADAINAATAHMKPGDTVMGFSLGSQVLALYLSQHPLPPGVSAILAGWTFAHNNSMVATGQGIPVDIPNQVTIVANEYDGWSDSPDLTSNPNYAAALTNSAAGETRLHYYANADLNNPANIKVTQGNITAITIPTQHLPQNDYLRGMGMDASVDSLDAKQRPGIDAAYSRQVSTPDQRAAAGAEQVPQPNPAWQQNPEPVLALP